MRKQHIRSIEIIFQEIKPATNFVVYQQSLNHKRSEKIVINAGPGSLEIIVWRMIVLSWHLTVLLLHLEFIVEVIEDDELVDRIILIFYDLHVETRWIKTKETSNE